MEYNKIQVEGESKMNYEELCAYMEQNPGAELK